MADTWSRAHVTGLGGGEWPAASAATWDPQPGKNRDPYLADGQEITAAGQAEA